MTQNGRPIPSGILSRSNRFGSMGLRGALGLLVVIVIVGLVGWVYLSQASEVAETERRIRELGRRKEELLRQNDQLAYEVAQLGSVQRLEKRARGLGYTAVWQAHFLAVVGYPTPGEVIVDETPALVRRDPHSRATPPAVAGWWETVASQFETWSQGGQP